MIDSLNYTNYLNYLNYLNSPKYVFIYKQYFEYIKKCVFKRIMGIGNFRKFRKSILIGVHP